MAIRALWCSVCVATLVAARADATPSFVRPTDPTSVPFPSFMTTADFNRDGHADVALSSTQGQVVSVLLGTASGALTGGTTYTIGEQLGDLAAGDINGDGRTDIAVVEQRGAGAHILLGAGNGTFAQPVFISGGRNATAVAIADLDGMNGADLILTDKGDDQVLVLMNTGRDPLAFAAGGTYGVGLDPSRVRLGDFNGDGHSDIVTLNVGGTRVHGVSMLLFDRVANALPVFRLHATSEVSAGPGWVTIADFDGDTRLDLALLGGSGTHSNGSVEVMLGQGNGFLVPGPTLPLTCPVFTDNLACRGLAFAAGDFDGDGIVDLAVTQNDPRALAAEDWLAIYRGMGDGRFVPGPVLGTDPSPSLTAVADVTGDGALDVIVAADRARTVEVFVNASTIEDGDRLPGQTCDSNLQCVTLLCRDAVCCRTECQPGERCDLSAYLGTCAPEDAQRPRGDRCDRGNQCASGFCVDQVCCIAGTCPTGARCDIPPEAGVCTNPGDIGEACMRGEHCRSGFCVDGFCCSDACADGRCDAPGLEGTCSGSLTDGRACSANAQCASGICDTTAQICCIERCAQTERCRGDGAACEPADVPTWTPTSQPPTPTAPPTPSAPAPTSCVGDCDGNRTVAVNELVTGVNIALGRAVIDTCGAFDTSGDRRVTVNELVSAVGSALRGCAP